MADDNILKLIANVQAELKAPKSQYNSFGRYNYRSAEDILEAVKPLLLAGIIPLGIALQKTGGAAMVAEQLLDVLGPYGPLATLAAIYLMTSALTEVMSNNASAVLVVPIALATAQSMGVDPKPLLIAVAFAASTSFATPISYQTNTMVYTAGGYRFSDFVRVGMPLNVIFWIAAITLIPRFFPFHP